MPRNELIISRDENKCIEGISGKYRDDLDLLLIDREVKKKLVFYKENPKPYLDKTNKFIEEYRVLGKKKVVIDFGINGE